jgi:hypothetical protein
MSNERILVFNYTGKVKDLPKALEQAIEEIEKRLDEPEPKSLKEQLNAIYGKQYIDTDSVPNCYSCPDKANCNVLNKILFNDPMYGEYLQSIFNPRD